MSSLPRGSTWCHLVNAGTIGGLPRSSTCFAVLVMLFVCPWTLPPYFGKSEGHPSPVRVSNNDYHQWTIQFISSIAVDRRLHKSATVLPSKEPQVREEGDYPTPASASARIEWYVSSGCLSLRRYYSERCGQS